MAKVHFVKDGKKSDGTRITRSVDISIADANEYLGRFEQRRSESPPTINPKEVASDFAPYRHVVLEVPEDEVSDTFPQAGYYYLPDLTPTRCEELLGESGPEI